MSGSTTLSGVAYSALTPTPQATDTDAALLLQGGMFRTISPRAQICSYTPVGAVLLMAGAGASRGAAPGALPTAGDPMAPVALAPSLTMGAPLVLGGPPQLGANIGTAAGTVAAGNDARIANAAQLDPSGDLNLAGQTLSLGNGALTISTDSTGHITLAGVGLTLSLTLANIDPLVPGMLWNNAGLLAVSAGP